MRIQPLNDRVLVKPFDAEEKTRGGIVIPDSAREKQQRGRVMAIGSGKLLDNGSRAPLAVNVGDVVVYGKYAGNEVKIDGQPHSIMRENEVLAILAD